MGNYYKKMEIDYKQVQSEKSGKSGKSGTLTIPTRTDFETSKEMSSDQPLLRQETSNPFIGGEVTLDVVSADLKRDTDTFSKMDPYVEIEL